MEISLVVFIILVIVAVSAVVKLTEGGKAGGYKQGKLMTDNELEFFGRLVAALPDHFIFPQVAMSALLQPSSTDRKQANIDRLRIAQQRVDYVVCDMRGKVVVVVELDDRTHSQAKDQVRDARCNQAGIRTVRFQSKNKPTADVIRSTVLPAPVVVSQTVPGKDEVSIHADSAVAMQKP
jgi:hypothetical protein